MHLFCLIVQVRTYNDLSFREMEYKLEEAANASHSDADCIFVAVLSHGELGILYASDHAYKPDRLWSPFNAERCPTLAGKPKLFFIQACRVIFLLKVRQYSTFEYNFLFQG